MENTFAVVNVNELIDTLVKVSKLNLVNPDILYSTIQDKFFLEQNGVKFLAIKSNENNKLVFESLSIPNQLKRNQVVSHTLLRLDKKSNAEGWRKTRAKGDKPPACPIRMFRFKGDTTWFDVFKANVDARLSNSKDSPDNLDVLMVLRRILAKNKIKATSLVSEKEYINYHKQARQRIARKKYSLAQDKMRKAKVDEWGNTLSTFAWGVGTWVEAFHASIEVRKRLKKTSVNNDIIIRKMMEVLFDRGADTLSNVVSYADYKLLHTKVRADISLLKYSQNVMNSDTPPPILPVLKDRLKHKEIVSIGTEKRRPNLTL